MDRTRFLKDDTYDFIKSLDLRLSVKAFSLLEILDKTGIYLGSPKLKKINKEIYELRVVGKTQVRILCVFKNEEIIILHAFIKKTQKIPKKELEIAIHRLSYLQ